MLKSTFAGVTDFLVRSFIWILYSVMYAFSSSCVFHPSLGLEPRSPYLQVNIKPRCIWIGHYGILTLFCLAVANFFRVCFFFLLVSFHLVFILFSMYSLIYFCWLSYLTRFFVFSSWFSFESFVWHFLVLINCFADLVWFIFFKIFLRIIHTCNLIYGFRASPLAIIHSEVPLEL